MAPVTHLPPLTGVSAPMRFEATVEDCLVEGDIPESLRGVFAVVGKTWKYPQPQGSFAQQSKDGMVQAYLFENGRVTYSNRWVRTPKFELEAKYHRGLFEYEDAWGDWRDTCMYPKSGDGRVTDGVPSGVAGTNIFPWYGLAGGALLTANELGIVPMEMDPCTLETKGIIDWGYQLAPGLAGTPSFTAHPKWDHETGEVYGWTYGTNPDGYITMHFVQPDGRVKTRTLDEVPYAAAVHDGWLTENYLILPVTPWYADPQRPLTQDLGMHNWDPSKPSCLVLVPRSLEGEIKYIYTDFDAEFVLHTVGAHERNGKIYLEGPLYDRPPFPLNFEDLPKGADYPPFPAAVYGRWVLDTQLGKIVSERLDDVPCELPKMDERFYGKNFENGFYLAGGNANLLAFNTIVHRNVVTGEQKSFTYKSADDVTVVEPTFAPRYYGAPEGDGYLLAPAILHSERLSELLIFDTADISRGPLATVKLPFQTGWISHGHYMDFNHVAKLQGI
ncbi:carotenoid oxygenase family protein [Gordonia sp. CPCC 205515]|uniref:carotenoid oxygenase family protein n=1 Tax=Gordonia sp. CPCC 205515 TaxID=3140791 RepID=UPI003AF3D1B6